jgi:hypothetical protein
MIYSLFVTQSSNTKHEENYRLIEFAILWLQDYETEQPLKFLQLSKQFPIQQQKSLNCCLIRSDKQEATTKSINE